MNWRVIQRILELGAVTSMMAGIVLMWLKKDPQHYLVYGGFALLASGKLVEALHINDPNFKIVKVAACLSIYLLVILNLQYHVRTLVYILAPLAVYYALHYRWLFQSKKA